MRISASDEFISSHVKVVFGDEEICASSDYQQPTVHALSGLPLLHSIRECLPVWLGSKAARLNAEGNHYYEVKSGIGFHGDAGTVVLCSRRFPCCSPDHPQNAKSSFVSVSEARPHCVTNGGNPKVRSHSVFQLTYKWSMATCMSCRKRQQVMIGCHAVSTASFMVQVPLATKNTSVKQICP